MVEYMARKRFRSHMEQINIPGKSIKIFDEMQKIITRYDYDSSEFVVAAYFGQIPGIDHGINRVMPKKWYASICKNAV